MKIFKILLVFSSVVAMSLGLSISSLNASSEFDSEVPLKFSSLVEAHDCDCNYHIIETEIENLNIVETGINIDDENLTNEMLRALDHFLPELFELVMLNEGLFNKNTEEVDDEIYCTPMQHVGPIVVLDTYLTYTCQGNHYNNPQYHSIFRITTAACR
ncbi:MAG: hypothetical protein FWF03_08040 [Defluviitaleaceae bacterium]|nr:hypothetical protein [Defluviitaleaceae bacterium]